MPSDPVQSLSRWLEYLDSHNGRLSRIKQTGKLESDYDVAALLPTPPGQTIFTVGDLRTVVGLLSSKQ